MLGGSLFISEIWLPTKHPEVNKKLTVENVTVQKTTRIFSALSIDQTHEQNNACVKDDGGAIVHTNNLRALLRLMIAGE